MNPYNIFGEIINESIRIITGRLFTEKQIQLITSDYHRKILFGLVPRA